MLSMDCCQCQGIERIFADDQASRELRDYQEDGPNQTTELLIEAVGAQGVEGLTLLDIGGGVGAIQHALLEAGARSATAVEASTAFARSSELEAHRRELSERITVRHANFVDVAGEIEPHDVVTLDRVICCYHDLPGLLGAAVKKANRLVALVYPRTTFYVWLAAKAANLVWFLTRNPFRTFIHPDRKVHGILEGAGWHRVSYEKTLLWQVVVWGR